jgi:hypothetical protein
LLRKTLAVIGGGAVLVLVTGCVSLDAELTIDADATADGTMTVGVNKQLMSFAGISSAEQLRQQVLDENALPEDASLSVEETDTDYVMKAGFSGATFDEEDWRIALDDAGDIEFTFVNEGMSSEDRDLLSAGSEESESGLGNIDITVNFPGDVTAYGGEGAQKIDSDTVRWEFPFSTANTITATSTVDSGPTAALLYWGAGAVAVLAVGAGAFLVRRRNARAKADAPLSAPPPPVS